MRVLITGELATPGAVARALDAAHNKRRIAIVLHLSTVLMSSMAADLWAEENGVLCADVYEYSGVSSLFAVADSIIAFPGTSAELLEMARKAGVKVWEPYKTAISSQS